MIMARKRPEPTDEQYRLAWPLFRGRGGCPDSLEAAKTHPRYGPCLRACAQNMGRPPAAPAGAGAAAQAAARLGGAQPVPPTPAIRPTVTPAITRAPAAVAPRSGNAGAAPAETRAAPWLHRRPARSQRTGAHDAKRAAANDRPPIEDSEATTP